ncbi:hypothetical protein C8J57DRAFT_1601452, partial [Mycena rebaudengoi]
PPFPFLHPHPPHEFCGFQNAPPPTISLSSCVLPHSPTLPFHLFPPPPKFRASTAMSPCPPMLRLAAFPVPRSSSPRQRPRTKPQSELRCCAALNALSRPPSTEFLGKINLRSTPTSPEIRRITSIHWYGFLQARKFGMHGPSYLRPGPRARAFVRHLPEWLAAFNDDPKQ